MQQIEYPWLARLSRWIDQAHEFLNLINGGVLWLGLAISLTDVLTDGWLTLAFGWLLIVWAVSQAIGVDSFIYHFSARARAHFDKKDWVPLVITAAVVGALGFVAWQAAYIFGASQVDHISIGEAINSLGMSGHDWLKLRFAGSVAMVVLSGFTRYVKAPARGARIVSPVPADADTTPYYQAAGSRDWQQIAESVAGVVSPDLRNPPTPRSRRPTAIRLLDESDLRNRPGQSKEAQARAVWQPGMSIPALQEAADISRATAQKYSAKFEAERGTERIEAHA